MHVTPIELAQAQLDAYNAHDIEAFLACYAEDVIVGELPAGNVSYVGRDAMRQRYTPMFAKATVHAELTDRKDMGQVIVDCEHVTGVPGAPIIAIAIYEMRENEIARVWFIRK